MTDRESKSAPELSRRAYLTRVFVVYLGGSYAVLELTDIFIDQLGLPDWFFRGVIALVLLGLPIVVATALVQTRRRGFAAEGPSEPAEEATTPADERAGVDFAAPGEPVVVPARPWLTWRKAIVGMVAAFALWGVVVAGYMTMRVFGIGPVGSLVAAGVIDERDRIIVAHFENNTDDPLLGEVATEAFRIDFSQSPIVTVVDAASVDQVLVRMQRDPGLPLDQDLAREVAIREGVKAVVTGEITPVANRFILAAELITAQDGQVLYAHRETASDSTQIIGAIDQLSKKLRERIGESLKTIRANEPLDRVTTPSLEALRQYSLAVRAAEQGDNERAIALLEEAVAFDTAFAMAWRKLGIVLGNIGRDRAREVQALTKAFEHRDRLTERERYMTVGSYHMSVTREPERAIAAYQSLLEVYPNDTWAMNNLAILYLNARDYRGADRLFSGAIELDSAGGALYYGNVISTRVALGDFGGAEVALQRFSERFPEHPTAAMSAAALASSQFDYDAAEQHMLDFRQTQRASEFWQLATAFQLAQIAEVQGQLARAEEYIQDAMVAAETQGQPSLYVNGAVRLAFHDAVLRGDSEAALRRIDEALQRHPLESLEPHERPYGGLAMVYALSGESDRARQMSSEWNAAVDPVLRGDDGIGDHVIRGVLALAAEQPREAVVEFRRADTGPCNICVLPVMGQAYDAAGEADSVIAVYERFIETPWLDRLDNSDWWALAGIYERLGGLYELNGDVERAAYYYEKFVELWEDADPELQPRVEAARRAIERLMAES
jgi:tetratricopeptide (TPR) repeat protein